MCGIFGFAKLKEHDLGAGMLRAAVRYLALRNQSRGKDSTGLACVLDNNDVFDVRKVKEATDFLDCAAVTGFIDAHVNKETKAALGHTRAATTGAVVKLNAQPFTVGAVTGTHNGVIRNWEELFASHNLTPATGCDSEVIFALLNKAGNMQEAAQLLGELDGYFALAWHDRRDAGALYLARSSGMLSAAFDSRRRLLFWSSEEDTLEALFRIWGLEPEPVRVSVDTMLRISLADGTLQQERIPSHWVRRPVPRLLPGYGGMDYGAGDYDAAGYGAPAASGPKGRAQGCRAFPRSAHELQFSRKERKRIAKILLAGGLPEVFRGGFCDGCGLYANAGRRVLQLLICFACEQLLTAAKGQQRPAALEMRRREGDTFNDDVERLYQ